MFQVRNGKTDRRYKQKFHSYSTAAPKASHKCGQYVDPCRHSAQALTAQRNGQQGQKLQNKVRMKTQKETAILTISERHATIA